MQRLTCLISAMGGAPRRATKRFATFIRGTIITYARSDFPRGSFLTAASRGSFDLPLTGGHLIGWRCVTPATCTYLVYRHAAHHAMTSRHTTRQHTGRPVLAQLSAPAPICFFLRLYIVSCSQCLTVCPMSTLAGCLPVDCGYTARMTARIARSLSYC